MSGQERIHQRYMAIDGKDTTTEKDGGKVGTISETAFTV